MIPIVSRAWWEQLSKCQKTVHIQLNTCFSRCFCFHQLTGKHTFQATEDQAARLPASQPVIEPETASHPADQPRQQSATQASQQLARQNKHPKLPSSSSLPMKLNFRRTEKGRLIQPDFVDGFTKNASFPAYFLHQQEPI